MIQNSITDCGTSGIKLIFVSTKVWTVVFAYGAR
jgi:hypothetical protein